MVSTTLERPPLTPYEQARRANAGAAGYGDDPALRAWPGSRSGLVIAAPTVDRRELARIASGHYRKLSDREIDAIRAGRARLITLPDGRYKVIPVPAGGALGQGAVYARNLPAPGTFDINPVLFAAKTSRNQKISPQISHPGYASSFAFRADAVGIISRFWLLFEATYTSTATPATVVQGHYPWNLARSVVVSANGINNLFACQGTDLRALMRVRNAKSLQDRESSFAIPGASAAGLIRLVWEIPLAYDDSLVGAVFAQTEETQLSLTVTTATQAELYSANVGTFSAANWRVVTEFFSIPTADTQAGRVLVLPDISQLHGVVTRDDGFTAAGDVVSPLTRTGGILLRTLQRIDNTTPGSMDPGASTGSGSPNTNVTSHRFRYGGNVVPTDVPAWVKRFVNETDYGDAVLPSADVVSGATPPNYMVDDHVIDSPLRDVIHLTGITEAQLINTVGAGVTVNSGAQVHTVQEAMVAG